MKSRAEKGMSNHEAVCYALALGLALGWLVWYARAPSTTEFFTDTHWMGRCTGGIESRAKRQADLEREQMAYIEEEDGGGGWEENVDGDGEWVVDEGA